MVVRALSPSQGITPGTKLLTLQPELEVVAGVPGLFFTTLRFPNGAATRVDIDTGSVGIVIPQSLVVDSNGFYQPWAVPTGESMEIVYKPSNDTISGPIVTLSGLSLGDGSIQIGPVKALAHTQAGTYMLGVGFGLEAISRFLAPPSRAGQSAATALDNPFLAIAGMSREPGAPFQAAYSLTASGPGPGMVTFGQTAQSISGFEFLSLTPDPTAPGGFQLPRVDLSVTTADGKALPTTRAQLLVDIGIGSSFIGVFNPSPPNPGALATRVDVDWPGASVNVSAVTDSGQPVLQYGFVNRTPGDGAFVNCDPNEKASPSHIMSGGSAQSGSFINTGGHLLAKYDYHFDAVNARVGFRRRSPAP